MLIGKFASKLNVITYQDPRITFVPVIYILQVFILIKLCCN